MGIGINDISVPFCGLNKGVALKYFMKNCKIVEKNLKMFYYRVYTE